MSEEQLKAFPEKVKTNTELQRKLKAFRVSIANAVVAIAKEAGFAVTAGDLMKMAQSEAPDDELVRASGGATANQPTPVSNAAMNSLNIDCSGAAGGVSLKYVFSKPPTLKVAFYCLMHTKKPLNLFPIPGENEGSNY